MEGGAEAAGAGLLDEGVASTVGEGQTHGEGAGKLTSPGPAPDMRLTDEIYLKGGPGSILHTVQMSGIFPDCKTFVDMQLLTSPHLVKKNFEILINDNLHSQDKLRDFILAHFSHVGEEMEECELHDWIQEPTHFSQVESQEIRDFCHELNLRWKILGRRQKETLLSTPQRSTLHPLPNRIVIPGGRFREVYYWDTYWIVAGLLACHMVETARGVIENLVSLVGSLGYVPNGGRRYYTRSQPPLLSAMVRDYWIQTGDLAWAASHVRDLEKEWNFWLQHRTIQHQGHTLFVYRCEEGEPRPESYREDYHLGELVPPECRSELFKQIRAAAESGWDFSSRWFLPPAAEAASPGLHHTRTSAIIPADLNAFLAQGAEILSDLHRALQHGEQAQLWGLRRDELVKAMEAVLWNEEDGIWYDYDREAAEQRRTYYISNLVPLWAGTFPKELAASRGRRVASYLKSHHLLKYPGGLPTSLVKSGQQWDFPNVWPPMEHMAIMGLHRSGDATALQTAEILARTAVQRSLKVFKQTGSMFEKYDCQEGAGVGGGGEYTVQLGFGWTNGALLDIVRHLPHLWRQGDDKERQAASIAVGSLLSDQPSPNPGQTTARIVERLLAEETATDEGAVAGDMTTQIVDRLLADRLETGS